MANEADKAAHSGDRKEEDIKAYSQKLQEKIDAIKAACDIQ